MKTTLSLLLPLGLLLLPATAAEKTKPNIILILADDVGYGDIGCYGATQVKTPNIDSLAAQGLLCSSGYAAAAVCTPTRFSMLTGKWPWRQDDTGILAGNAPLCIHEGTVTLPEMMQRAGYTTGIVGKWHLGFGRAIADFSKSLNPGPKEVGFDYSFVLPATNDRVPTVFVRGHEVINADPNDPLRVHYQRKIGNEPDGVANADMLTLDVRKNPDPHRGTINEGVSRIGWMTGGKAARWKDQELSDVFAAEAVKFIENHKKKPFFLYFSTHTVHEPQVPAKRFQGSSQCGVYGDVLQELDWSVGEIIKTIDRLDLADNTIIIFSSDNGAGLYQNESYKYEEGGRDPYSHGRNGKLRGGKGDQWEGGTRVPFIVRWPAKIKANATSSEIVSLTDLPATCAAILGQKSPAGYAPDSVNVLPALLGTGKGREFTIAHHYRGSGNLAIRKGPWKLFPWNGGAQLYNLADDIGETKDVAAQHPEMVKELTDLLELVRDGAAVTAEGDCDQLIINQGKQ